MRKIQIVIISVKGRVVYDWIGVFKSLDYLEILESSPEDFRLADFENFDFFVVDEGCRPDQRHVLPDAEHPNHSLFAGVAARCLRYYELNDAGLGYPQNATGIQPADLVDKENPEGSFINGLGAQILPKIQSLHIDTLATFVENEWINKLGPKIDKVLAADPMERSLGTIKCKALKEQKECLLESLQQIKGRISGRIHDLDHDLPHTVSKLNLERAFLDAADHILWKQQLFNDHSTEESKENDKHFKNGGSFEDFLVGRPNPSHFVEVNRGMLYIIFLRFFMRQYNSLSNSDTAKRLTKDEKLVRKWKTFDSEGSALQAIFEIAPNQMLQYFPERKSSDEFRFDESEPHSSYLTLLHSAQLHTGNIVVEEQSQEEGQTGLRLVLDLIS